MIGNPRCPICGLYELNDGSEDTLYTCECDELNYGPSQHVWMKPNGDLVLTRFTTPHDFNPDAIGEKYLGGVMIIGDGDYQYINGIEFLCRDGWQCLGDL